jgi:3-phosphoshikimate 1-carboxyvinyltransferase
MLTTFSCATQKKNQTIIIDSAAVLHGSDVHVPGDMSSAAFFIVAATLIPDSDILLQRVNINPTRVGMIRILQQMGADISWQQTDLYGDEPVADVRVRYAPLQGVDVSAEYVPFTIDEFPILFIASACASGQTHFRGVRELRYKESDRIAVMLEGLKALGIEGLADEDNVRIQGGVLQGGVVSSYDDHRVAMAFVIAGAVAREPVTVLNCDAVSTSFPQFMATAHQIHLHIEDYHDES